MQVDNEFNRRQLCKIEKLLALRKDRYRVDLHIHTNNSADGLQTVKQAFHKARETQFDIISIADHDSIDAYREIFESGLDRDDSTPIIIPGVEFTVSYPEYEGRCHVLKYFYDINDVNFLGNLSQNRQGNANRVKIWFDRIHENKCLQYYFNRFDVACSEEAYWNYLKLDTIKIPEYHTLMEYLYSLLSEKGVNVWDVYKRTVADNESDLCNERKDKKTRALQNFYNKYCMQDIAHNYRKLRPILAPLGVDDMDYPDFESSGSLSVGEYGQVPLLSLKNSGFNVLAHPDINKLHCTNNLTDILSGLELNCHSSDAANNAVFLKAQEISMLITKGSDKHSHTNEFYEELHFYDMTYNELQKIVLEAKKSIAL